MSTDESASPEMARTEQAAQPKQGSMFRIVLFVILVLAVIALIIDWRGQAAAEELSNKIGGLLDAADKDPERKRPSIDEVHKVINREPSETYDQEKAPNMKVEEYRFRGGLPWKSHTVYVYYRTAPEERLYSVSLNQPEEF